MKEGSEGEGGKDGRLTRDDDEEAIKAKIREALAG